MTSLALFDLDHTLLPLDSEYEWTRYLVRVGALDAAEADDYNARWLEAYQAGTLDARAHARFALGLLARHPRLRLEQWRADFMREVIEPALLPDAAALLAHHRHDGALCCIVTATCRFVAEPIAVRLGVRHLIAVEAVVDGSGEFTGELEGEPSFGAGKVVRVAQWLQAQNLRREAFDRIFFYSDSRNDIPLLEQVSDPVAVNPDASLLALARARGWPVLALSTDAPAGAALSAA
ncbi:phosphoserine phosphatase [Cupriavidus sp. USMAA2-4]|uniref:Phosphoserine phosphatase n=1 Tax=Cupriavidus malaysiensis TaxID=367825 RepID=A0ABN4TW49_9BURK|nr:MULTISPECIES: HAD-IB family hydrolase [Cupriavidus]AOY96626.1 phosphoserine phosphatase [Cupriavidus sp. USMAA2-4]AOZ02968.1 phosphoserine phosphatase [Cupriavidus sp. USMAHM13]AOZ09660.1 phosphoserine phosphatase [Cupriavidus malaysiensis]